MLRSGDKISYITGPRFQAEKVKKHRSCWQTVFQGDVLPGNEKAIGLPFNATIDAAGPKRVQK